MFKATLIFALFLAACVMADDEHCTPGSTKREDCNTCVCAGDGHRWACTKMACPPEVSGSEPPPSACEEGKSWKQDCNTCTCSNGVPVCTLIACLDAPKA